VPSRRPGLGRRLRIPLAAGGAVVATVVALVTVSLASGPGAATENAAPPIAVAEATSVPGGVLARATGIRAATRLEPVRSGSPLTIAGKPGVVFVSEESCPFCAAERWPVVVALSHFGTWSNLGSTTSSSTDVYPRTATFSFRNVDYTSPVISLRTTELTDNVGHPLQQLTSLDDQLLGTYDVPPYVNSADQSGAVPFLDIGNRYVLAGAQYDPQILAGLSVSQIAAQLKNPSSRVAQAVDASADTLIAAIAGILHSPVVST
jgi:Domain of unknown function (DUF929)